MISKDEFEQISDCMYEYFDVLVPITSLEDLVSGDLKKKLEELWNADDSEGLYTFFVEQFGEIDRDAFEDHYDDFEESIAILCRK